MAIKEKLSMSCSAQKRIEMGLKITEEIVKEKEKNPSNHRLSVKNKSHWFCQVKCHHDKTLQCETASCEIQGF